MNENKCYFGIMYFTNLCDCMIELNLEYKKMKRISKIFDVFYFLGELEVRRVGCIIKLAKIL